MSQSALSAHQGTPQKHYRLQEGQVEHAFEHALKPVFNQGNASSDACAAKGLQRARLQALCGTCSLGKEPVRRELGAADHWSVIGLCFGAPALVLWFTLPFIMCGNKRYTAFASKIAPANSQRALVCEHEGSANPRLKAHVVHSILRKKFVRALPRPPRPSS